jgi:polysaccharide export outer membrane protein
MKILTLSLCMLLAVPALSVSAQTPVPQPPPSPVPPGFPDSEGQYLSPGDEVRIQVWRQTEFSGDFQVAANGTLVHPLYREVQVAGVPLSVVEDRIRTFLTRYMTTPQFVIQPLVKIIVAGEVRSPNIYSVPPQMTIAQAIANAGGATDRGNLSDVRVIRDRQLVRVDVSKPSSEAAQLQIRSNDQILVSRRRASTWEVIGPITGTLSFAVGLANLFWRR